MTGFAGGVAQAGYMARVRDLAPQRCLVVPVDVGKHSAMALVADHYGQIVGDPFEFRLTVSGVDGLVTVIEGVTRRAAADSVRVGIEAAGHYHQALATTLRGKGFDVVELNPYQVKIARAQLGQARIKTDLRDCMAMVELLVRGQGWPLHREDGAVAEQAALVAHRRRKLAAAQALGSQIHALADVAFPGLTACFRTGLEAKSPISSVDEARSGLKIVVRSPADVVALWSVEAVAKSGAGSCAVGPSVLPSSTRTRFRPFLVAPAGDRPLLPSGEVAGRVGGDTRARGDHRAGRRAGYR